jgi:hypothetical protein
MRVSRALTLRAVAALLRRASAWAWHEGRVMGQTLLDQLRQKRIARIFPPWLVNGSRGRGADVGAGA